MSKDNDSVREWLAGNGYEDVARMIDEIMAEWKREGKETRRNWWDILAGDADGNPRSVKGRTFPVLRAARRRKGLVAPSTCLCRNKAERIPPMVPQVRWGAPKSEVREA